MCVEGKTRERNCHLTDMGGGGGRGRRKGRSRGFASRNVLVVATMLVCCVGSAAGLCVVDNKKGWHVQCGVRDSYLFRLKDYGGLNANFDFSFGIGDEAGYPLSIKNTKGHHYYKRKDKTARTSTGDGERREDVGGGGGGGGAGARGSWPRLPLNLRPPAPHYLSPERSSSTPVSSESGVVSGHQSANNDASSAPSAGERNLPFSASSTGGGAAGGAPYTETHEGSAYDGGRSSFWPARRRSDTRRQSSSSSSSLSSFFSRFLSWLPWPFGESSWFSGGNNAYPSRADARKSHFRVIHQPLSNDLHLSSQSFNPQQPFHPQQPSNPQQPFHPQQPSNPQQPFHLQQPFHSQPFTPQSFNPKQPFGGPPFIPPPFGIPPFNPVPGLFPPFPHPPPPQLSHGPPPKTVGPAVADVLQVSPDTLADTDHVPSFAAKVFVVREAPKDYHPPGYTPSDNHQHQPATVEVPRTKFFCEEQRYLPGLYADTQLGCKVFHMCLPAAVGNTQTSFLCPNMTLFDQSILQCNWWYYVRCEDSPLNYDANLPFALSYRKVNAAQLPLTAIRDYNALSLLDVSARTARNLEEKGAVGRMGVADASKEEEKVEEEKVEDENATPAGEEAVEKTEDGEKGRNNDGEEDLDANSSSSSSYKKITDNPDVNMKIRRVEKLVEEEDQWEREEIKADTHLRRKRRRRRSIQSVLSLPTRRHLDSLLLSRLHRRKNTLP